MAGLPGVRELVGLGGGIPPINQEVIDVLERQGVLLKAHEVSK